MNPGLDIGLNLHGVTVRFGGHVALSAVDLAAPVGTITGLIGPNGAGKTTLFNVGNGLIRPAIGTVELFGRDVTRSSVSSRARAGLGRTFQQMEICNDMTVARNVALGYECRVIGNNPLRQFVAGGSQRRLIAEHCDAAIHACGLEELAGRRAGSLSVGQRRLLELARVIAGGFRLLLLDEPSSGLDETETRHFGSILQSVMRDHDLGILLVEHDMALVMSVCSDIYVLDFGTMIFHGDPASVRDSDVVRSAYLGNDLEEALRP